MKLATLP